MKLSDIGNPENTQAPKLSKLAEELRPFAKPSRFELCTLYFLLGMHAVMGTDASVPLGWHPVLFSSLALVCCIFLVRLLAAIFAPQTARAHAGKWIELLCIVMVFAMIYATNWGLSIRVFFSEKALLRQVQYVQESKGDTYWFWRGSSCGLFTVHAGMKNLGLDAQKTGTRVVWLVTASGPPLFEPPYGLSGGLVWCPNGPPPDTSESTYQHLYGPWWRWLEDT